MDQQTTYDAFNLVFIDKEDATHKINPSFKYKGKDFNYVKAHHKDYSPKELLEILQIYNIAMDYKNHGGPLSTFYVHQQRVVDASHIIRDYMMNLQNDDDFFNSGYFSGGVMPTMNNLGKYKPLAKPIHPMPPLKKAETGYFCSGSHESPEPQTYTYAPQVSHTKVNLDDYFKESAGKLNDFDIGEALDSVDDIDNKMDEDITDYMVSKNDQQDELQNSINKLFSSVYNKYGIEDTDGVGDQISTAVGGVFKKITNNGPPDSTEILTEYMSNLFGIIANAKKEDTLDTPDTQDTQDTQDTEDTQESKKSVYSVEI